MSISSSYSSVYYSGVNQVFSDYQIISNIFESFSIVLLQIVIKQVVLHLSSQDVFHRQEVDTLHVIMKVVLVGIIEALCHPVSQRIGNCLHASLLLVSDSAFLQNLRS